MDYVCLLYLNERELDSLPPGEMDALNAAHHRFDDSLVESGLQAKDLDEAIGIASRIPSARLGTVEVRPLRPLMIDGKAHWCMERISALGGKKS